MELPGQLGFRRDPFASARTRPYMMPQLRAARRQLFDLIARGVPIVFVTGPSGVGKSLLLASVAKLASRQGFGIGEIGRGDQAHSLIGAGADLLLIDEAESITTATLSALAPGQPQQAARTIVFAAVDAFAYRIQPSVETAEIRIGRLDAAGARAYLLGQAAAAGNSDLFTDEALNLIAAAANGSVRRLRVIGGAALFQATLENAARVGAEHVAEALTTQIEARTAPTLAERIDMPACAGPAPVAAPPPIRPVNAAADGRILDARRRRSRPSVLAPMALAASVAVVALVSAAILNQMNGPTDETAFSGTGSSQLLPLTMPLPLRPPHVGALIPSTATPILSTATTPHVADTPALAESWKIIPVRLARRPIRIAWVGPSRLTRPIRIAPAGFDTPVETLIEAVVRPPVASQGAERSLALDVISASRQRLPIVATSRRPNGRDDDPAPPVMRQGAGSFAPDLVPVADIGRASLVGASESAAGAVVPPSAAAAALNVPDRPATPVAATVTDDRNPVMSAASVDGPLFPSLAAVRPQSGAPKPVELATVDIRSTEAGQATLARDVSTQGRTAKEAADQAKAAKADGDQPRSARDAADAAKAAKELVTQTTSTKDAVDQTRTAKQVAELAKSGKDAVEQARSAKDATEQANAAKDVASLAKTAKDSSEQAKAAKDAADQASVARSVADTAKAAKDAADQAKAAKEAADQSKAAKEAADQAKAAKDAADQAKAVKDAADQAKAAKDAADQAKAAKDAADQAKAAKEAADQASVARSAVDTAKAAKDAADAAKVAKETADTAKAAKDAADQAKAAKEAADQAKAAKEAADQAKAAKDAADQAKAAKEATEQAKAAKDAADQAKSAKEAADQAKAAKEAADQAKAAKEAADQAKAAKDAADQAKAAKEAADQARAAKEAADQAKAAKEAADQAKAAKEAADNAKAAKDAAEIAKDAKNAGKGQ